MDTVVISATRTEESVKDLPLSPVIIDEQTLRAHPDKDLGQLLEEAGIAIDRQYPEGGMPVIRGMTGIITGTDIQSDVLMLFNGHRFGTSNMLRFPSKNIERIEVIRGPAALQYGSSAMGGVINVITKKGAGDFSSTLNIGAGSFGRFETGFLIDGKFRQFDYSFGYNNMEQGEPFKVGGGETYLHTAIGLKSEGSFNVGYNFNDHHRLGLIYDYIEVQDYGFPGTLASAKNATSPSKIFGHTYFFDFNYGGETEDQKWKWNAKYFFGHDLTFMSQNPYSNDIKGGQAQVSADINQINTTITLGFDWTEYDYINSLRSTTVKAFDYTEFGGFLLGTLKLLDDRLIFTGGGRLNYYENHSSDRGGFTFTDKVITPSLGVSYQADDWIKVRANFARGYRAPAAMEMFGEGNTMIGRHSIMLTMLRPPRVATGVWLVPNLDLKPQEISSIEAGFDLELNGLNASLTAFLADYKNKIEREETQPPIWRGPGIWNGYPVFFPNPITTTQAYVSSAQYINAGGAKVAGLEWNISYDLSYLFDWEFSLKPYSRGTWLWVNEYVGGNSDGLQISKTPNLYASNGILFESDRFGLLIDANVMTKSNQRTSSLTSMSTAPEWQHGWTIANLMIRKQLWTIGEKNSFSLMAQVNNIFDVYYEVTSGYPLPGRAFYLGLSYTFN
ncbi:MAG: TonB-dependent receptor [Deltaproteobacteria bacterium]|nr:TonB-dependent receptor [Deltaproteobacteria bacterium]